MKKVKVKKVKGLSGRLDNVSAAILRINPSTLGSRMRKLGIDFGRRYRNEP
jgi:hypothetical protein